MAVLTAQYLGRMGGCVNWTGGGVAVLPNNTLDSWSVCYLTISLGNSVAVLTEVLLGRVAGVMVLAKQIPWVGRVAVLTE